MNNDKETNITSGNISVWVRTSILSQLTNFLAFGSKRAVLSWDIEKKTLSLDEVDKSEKKLSTIFTAMASQVNSAYFPSGKDFFMTVDGKRYDISIRNSYTNSVFAADAMEAIDGDLVGAYSDIKSNLNVFRAFLKKEGQEKVFVSPINSHMTLRSIVGVGAILVAIAAIGFGVAVISRSNVDDLPGVVRGSNSENTPESKLPACNFTGAGFVATPCYDAPGGSEL